MPMVQISARFEVNGPLLDAFFAPYASDFREPILPNLSKEFPSSNDWIHNFALNCLGGPVTFRPPHRAVVHNMIFRVQTALEAYNIGRIVFLRRRRSSKMTRAHYYNGLAAFETVLLNIQIALDCSRRIFGEQFSSETPSVTGRIWTLANRIKHSKEYITQPDDINCLILPVWMTNKGLASSNLEVSWSELTAELRDMGSVAEAASNPATFSDWISARNRGVAKPDPAGELPSG